MVLLRAALQRLKLTGKLREVLAHHALATSAVDLAKAAKLCVFTFTSDMNLFRPPEHDRLEGFACKQQASAPRARMVARDVAPGAPPEAPSNRRKPAGRLMWRLWGGTQTWEA